MNDYINLMISVVNILGDTYSRRTSFLNKLCTLDVLDSEKGVKTTEFSNTLHPRNYYMLTRMWWVLCYQQGRALSPGFLLLSSLLQVPLPAAPGHYATFSCHFSRL